MREEASEGGSERREWQVRVTCWASRLTLPHIETNKIRNVSLTLLHTRNAGKKLKEMFLQQQGENVFQEPPQAHTKLRWQVVQIAEERGRAREGEEVEERGRAREGEEAEERGRAREGEEAEERGRAREGEEAEERGRAREGEEAEERGRAREGEEVEERGRAREGEEAEERGRAREVEEAGGSDNEGDLFPSRVSFLLQTDGQELAHGQCGCPGHCGVERSRGVCVYSLPLALECMLVMSLPAVAGFAP